MQNIWFPAPVFLFFRRLVNVVSTLSISQQYLLQQQQQQQQHKSQENVWGFRTLEWLAQWTNSPRFALANHSEEQQPYEPSITRFPPPEPSPPPPQQQKIPRPPDQIHTLLDNPVLLDPIRKPRYPIVLCHGELRQPYLISMPSNALP